jgi:hypothetical protein
MGTINQTPCGDMYQPPTRSNLTLFNIIELVIMFVVGVLCAVDLVNNVKVIREKNIGVVEILTFIDDIVVVCALVYIVIGLFCAFTNYQVKWGIFLFAVAGIVAMVIILLQIINGHVQGDKLLVKILLFILYLFLTWILWNQAARLS